MHRQIQLLGKESQQILSNKTISIIGCGALGTVTAELLLRSGITNLHLYDRDIVEEHNLQRQLFNLTDINTPKVDALKKNLQKINPNTKITTHFINLDHTTDLHTKINPNIILDCTDNLETRFIINDTCHKHKTPWIYAAAIKTSGYIMPILPNKPCLRCFLKTASLETCATAGVLNTITTSISALQVTTTLKLLLNKPLPQLIHYNIWDQTIRHIKINKHPDCPTCNQQYLTTTTSIKPITFCSKTKYLFPIKNHLQTATKLKTLGATQQGSVLRYKNCLLLQNNHILIDAPSETAARTTYSKYIGN